MRAQLAHWLKLVASEIRCLPSKPMGQPLPSGPVMSIDAGESSSSTESAAAVGLPAEDPCWLADDETPADDDREADGCGVGEPCPLDCCCCCLRPLCLPYSMFTVCDR